MKKTATFSVYNASAGSGKTYTLVRDYLGILLQKKDAYYFRHILALTFTNKASAEMKQRILENLQCFISDEINDMKRDLMQKTGLDALQIAIRSKAILEAILFDYSNFHITTIDSFTHRIIRSFAFDFGLSSDFDVELDTGKILQEALDSVLDQIGIDTPLTQALIHFSLQKSDEDKAWDITANLYEFSKILLNETDQREFETLTSKTHEDYQRLQKKLFSQRHLMEKKMSEIGKFALEIIDFNGINHEDFFYKGRFPKHFIALEKNWQNAKFFDQSVLQNDVESRKFYKEKISTETKNLIDSVLPELVPLYSESEQLYSKLLLSKFLEDSIVPMSILTYIYKAVKHLKSDYNIQFISDFNELIQHKIKDEAAPFIYERLGETFKHYFIDEMQDTSVLQWQNLISLIDNALSQEEGSLLLVGDVKQSIYRWRGSNPEQFMALSNPHSNEPFNVSKNVINLDTNFRSFTEIIDFNNHFFSHISDVLQNTSYQSIYQNETYQKQNSQKGGYVQIEFLIKDPEDEDKNLIYPKKVLDTIKNLDQNFEWKDVCVLVRTNKQGTAIAQYLTENGIDVLSSESLLLNQNSKIIFLIHVLKIMYHPMDLMSRYEVLDFLYEHLNITTSKHQFFSELIDLSNVDFYTKLSYYIDIQYEIFHQKTLYDGVEYLIRNFKLNDKSNVYLQFFLEFVLDFQIQNGTDLAGFIDYWEQKNEKLSISVPDGKNALKVMSIHKAKGLQFPIVIYPYNVDIYKDIQPKEWYNFGNPESFEGFQKFLISYRKDLQYTDDEGMKIVTEHRQKQELDNLNILYVALTRAVEQLYILTDNPLDSKGALKINSFSGLFARFLQSKNLWLDEKTLYSFGKISRVRVETKLDKCKKPKPVNEVIENFTSSPLSSHQLVFHTHSSQLWNTDQGNAIDYGNLIHQMLAQIISHDDLKPVLHQYVAQGLILPDDMDEVSRMLLQLIQHPQLHKYFNPDLKIMCEREILTTDGQIHIPDRIVFFSKNEVGILDYKTGIFKPEHEIQIALYSKILQEMGYVVQEKYLVYLGETLKLV